MSKVLKAVAARHRPHLAAKMTKENGYDETKHHLSGDLAKAGILSEAEAKDLENCIDDLSDSGSDAAMMLKAAASGEVKKDRLNDDDIMAALFGGSDEHAVNGDLDDADGDDDGELDDEDADEDITA